MKKTVLFTALTALLLASGCSTIQTVPATPEPHPDKYALQVLRIEVPVDESEVKSLHDQQITLLNNKNGSTGPFDDALKSVPFTQTSDPGDPLLNILGTSHNNIEELLNNPQAKITEFPIVYAAVGETAINDQTETISAPENFEPVTNANGVISVVYSDETAKVGQYVEMTLKEVKNGTASCDLLFYENSLQGMQTYDIAPATEKQTAATASLPIFKKLKVDTSVTLAPGAWIGLGGLINEKAEPLSSGEIVKTTISRITWVRILPPKNNP